MTEIDFKNCLKAYKDLKDFLTKNYDLGIYDTFGINQGVLSIYRYNFMDSYREEQISFKDILSKLDKKIMF